MVPFSPVTDAELARARTDSAFRHKLLIRNLELLLTGLQKAAPGAGLRQHGERDARRRDAGGTSGGTDPECRATPAPLLIRLAFPPWVRITPVFPLAPAGG